MYKKNAIRQSKLRQNDSVEGNTIEQQIERLLTNKETPLAERELIYTARIDNVLPSYNIRTDRFEVALDAMDKVAGSYRAKREDRHKPQEPKADMKIVGDESIQGTENN